MDEGGPSLPEIAKEKDWLGNSSILNPMRRSHRHHASFRLYLVSLVAFGAVTAAAILLTRGYTLDTQTGRIAKTGLVIVRSLPSSAYITVNGRVRQERTPARLKLQPGSYTIKVDKPGSKPFEKPLEIAAETATFEEDILLFREPVEERVLAENVIRQASSPDHRQLAYLQSAPEGVTLSVTSAGGTPTKLTTLGVAYRAPITLAWSADAGAIVSSTATETTITPLSGTPVTVPVGGAVSLTPGSRNEVLAVTAGRLNRHTAGAPPTPISGDVIAWTVSSAGVYVATTDATVTRYDLRSDAKRVVSSGLLMTDLRAAETTEDVFGRTSDRTLYHLTPDAQTATRVATDVDQYQSSQGFLSYLSRQEIHVWKKAPEHDRLVTRLGAPIDETLPISDGKYVLYTQGGNIHAIAVDGTNDVVLAKAGSAPLTLLDETALATIDPAGRLRTFGIIDR